MLPDVDYTGGRHAAPKRGHGKAGGDSGSDCRDATANKHFHPWDPSRLQGGDRHLANAAGLGLSCQSQFLARMMLEILRCHPPEFFFKDHLGTAAPVVMSQHDGSVEEAATELGKDVARSGHMHLQYQIRVRTIYALQQQRQLGADDVVAYPNHQFALLSREGTQGPLMGRNQATSGGKENVAFRREPH